MLVLLFVYDSEDILSRGIILVNYACVLAGLAVNIKKVSNLNSIPLYRNYSSCRLGHIFAILV